MKGLFLSSYTSTRKNQSDRSGKKRFVGEILMLEGLLQPQHLLIILVVALFAFGPKKLPELGQGLGKGIRSFKESMKAATEEPEKSDPVPFPSPSERK